MVSMTAAGRRRRQSSTAAPAPPVPSEARHGLDRRLGEKREHQVLGQKIHFVVLDTLKTENVREHDRQDDHQDQRIQHRPEEPDDRTLVANGEVPPNQVPQQVRAVDEFADLPDGAELRVGGVDENRGL